MSKNKNPQEAEIVEDVVENKQEANIKDVLQTLKAQLQEHQRQADYHKTMAIKAEGALEVLLQLHPQKENNETK